MYVLSVRTQNELAFFRNIVGMDSVEGNYIQSYSLTLVKI